MICLPACRSFAFSGVQSTKTGRCSRSATRSGRGPLRSRIRTPRRLNDGMANSISLAGLEVRACERVSEASTASRPSLSPQRSSSTMRAAARITARTALATVNCPVGAWWATRCRFSCDSGTAPRGAFSQIDLAVPKTTDRLRTRASTVRGSRSRREASGPSSRARTLSPIYGVGHPTSRRLVSPEVEVNDSSAPATETLSSIPRPADI